MAIAITTTSPATPKGAISVSIIGGTPGAVVRLRRMVGTRAETIPGEVILNGSGAGSYLDRLYPLDATFQYQVLDSTATVVLGTSGFVVAVPSGGMPWIRDTVFSEALSVPVNVVDLNTRNRPGRVSTYTVVGQAPRVTVGDQRSRSDGAFQLLAFSHAERDSIIATLSTGNPCQLRVPSGCQHVLDEMIFTPLDIGEVRFGGRGWNVLDVSFVEVEPSQVPVFVPITYLGQTANATTASMVYSGLTAAFVGKTYRELYLSPTGIAP